VRSTIEFHDHSRGSDHDHFMKWRRESEVGFYLTLKSKQKANLHAATCKHQGNYDYGEYPGSATADRKVCAAMPDSLYDWARAEGVVIHRCATCDPPGEADSRRG
jgi:hypothetical protein